MTAYYMIITAIILILIMMIIKMVMIAILIIRIIVIMKVPIIMVIIIDKTSEYSSVPEDEVEDDITLELVNHNNTSSMQQQQQQQQQQVQVQPQKEDHSSLSLKRHASIKDLDKIDEHFKLEDDSGVGLEQNDLENEFQVSATNLPFGQLILDLIDHSEDLDTEREDHNADHDSETEDHLGESSS